ncbi:C40 family peptidase, partial [Citrobacter sedlakii]
MNKLKSQIGKPYGWGCTSPRTGFDCSGLVYYGYKDLVFFFKQKTAYEMTSSLVGSAGQVSTHLSSIARPARSSF